MNEAIEINNPELHNIKNVGAVMIEAVNVGTGIIYNAVLGEFSRAASLKHEAVNAVLNDAKTAKQFNLENF